MRFEEGGVFHFGMISIDGKLTERCSQLARGSKDYWRVPKGTGPELEYWRWRQPFAAAGPSPSTMTGTWPGSYQSAAIVGLIERGRETNRFAGALEEETNDLLLF